MMPQTLPLSLFIVLLSLSGSFEAGLNVLFSSNVTSLEAGKSAKLSCQLDNFEQGNEGYDVSFYRDNIFCSYDISAPDSSGQRSTTFHNDTRDWQPTLGRHPLSSTFPVYEITVTPTLASTQKYYCGLHRNNPNIDVFSNHLSLTVTPPSPTALLSSDVISPLLGHPFTLSCTFAHFTPPQVNYSVQFRSSRDGQLAVYDVANGESLLADGINEKVDVSHGLRSTYPNFDLIITEKVNISSAYWCTLVEVGKTLVHSNKWPLSVHFTASTPAENQRAATCSVVDATGLDLAGKAYTVLFVSDFGPKTVNLLAEYIFNPTFGKEFKSANLTSWGTIHYGPSTSWPNFSILANGTGSLNGTWWCVLAIGAKWTPDYREITSEKVNL